MGIILDILRRVKDGFSPSLSLTPLSNTRGYDFKSLIITALTSLLTSHRGKSQLVKPRPSPVSPPAQPASNYYYYYFWWYWGLPSQPLAWDLSSHCQVA
jgi:hypothetical protein